MSAFNTDPTGISIQVSLSGFSFKLLPSGESSSWLGNEQLFTMPEFQRRYSTVEISLLTPKVALVPESFFNEQAPGEALSEVMTVDEGDYVEWVKMPEYGSVLVYSNSIGESLSRVLSQTVLPASGDPVKVLPEMYYILRSMSEVEEYNKIVASFRDGWLHLAIAQGKSLRLANVFKAPDFTTAQYFIFLTLKQLQLNPEVSTMCLRTPVDMDSRMSLYRYFKAVVQI
ncbi:MAG: DUF3822 family protein [Bacteroidales bacterium]|nr:DUF3822 family protein [Bacteroidales bacterium]